MGVSQSSEKQVVVNNQTCLETENLEQEPVLVEDDVARESTNVPETIATEAPPALATPETPAESSSGSNPESGAERLGDPSMDIASSSAIALEEEIHNSVSSKSDVPVTVPDVHLSQIKNRRISQIPREDILAIVAEIGRLNYNTSTITINQMKIVLKNLNMSRYQECKRYLIYKVREEKHSQMSCFNDENVAKCVCEPDVDCTGSGCECIIESVSRTIRWIGTSVAIGMGICVGSGVALMTQTAVRFSINYPLPAVSITIMLTGLMYTMRWCMELSSRERERDERVSAIRRDMYTFFMDPSVDRYRRIVTGIERDCSELREFRTWVACALYHYPQYNTGTGVEESVISNCGVAEVREMHALISQNIAPHGTWILESIGKFSSNVLARFAVTGMRQHCMRNWRDNASLTLQQRTMFAELDIALDHMNRLAIASVE
jgi:hypothetical protein